MTFWHLANVPLNPFRPGINSAAAIGNGLIMVCMEIAAGKEDLGHTHPFDQCGIVVEGAIEMSIGEERKYLSERDAYFIPGGTNHGWKTFDKPVKLLDVSSTK